MAMMRKTCLGRAVLGLGLTATLATGQVVTKEQDTTVTGPRGRTIQRDITVQRGPGFVNRQVEIKRPGETIIRDTRVQTGGGGGRTFMPAYGGPRYFGGPRFVENVFVQRPPIISTFIGLPALSFGFGGLGGGFGGGGPVGGPPGSPAPPQAFDPFADAIGRLKSFHGSSRRDGALTLGRIGDPRAIPALNERLEHDFDKEVRVAAATALGEIADERGAIALEKAIIHDHRNEVREAAKLALTKIPKPGEQLPPQSVPPVPYSTHSKTPPPIPGPSAVLDPGPKQVPSPNVPLEPPLEDMPPPPPVPAPPTRPALEPPSNSGSSPDQP